ncbi:MAG: prepilin-type N-terminal cleavage/methylation domain-containing protein [Planctomycetes bacterium]|nr:prepilin-type N-terminal cleavage/methylation domain-containing protein [Planctomycetota bacterium]
MRRENGLTLVEVAVAMAILAIGALGLAASFFSTSDLGRTLREERIANKEILAKISEVQARGRMDSGDDTYLNSLLSYYSDSANTTFDIVGMVPPEGSQNVGQIILHLNEDKIPYELGADEDTLYVEDGMYYGEMDIDGDAGSKKDYSSLSGDLMDQVMLAPVEVRVSWRTRNGTMSISRFVAVARYDAVE